VYFSWQLWLMVFLSLAPMTIAWIVVAYMAVRLTRSICAWLDAKTAQLSGVLPKSPVVEPPVSSWVDLNRKADEAFKVVGIPDDKYQPPR
jgi:hypothetical protein